MRRTPSTADAGWQPTGRTRGAVTVVLAHLLLAWLAWQWAGRSPRPMAPPFVAVRLLPFEAPRPRASHMPPNMPSASASPLPPRSKTAAAMPVPTAAQPPLAVPPATSSTSAATPPESPAPALPATSGTQPPALPPLNLNLPRARLPSVQQQALHDDRSNTRRLNIEERMARDLDDNETTEPMADGSIRHRRGAQCSIEHPARVAQLVPFDETSRRAPPVWGPCP